VASEARGTSGRFKDLWRVRRISGPLDICQSAYRSPGRIRVPDRKCSRINGLAPYGEHRRLLGVELTARCVDNLWQPDVWIAKELRLPHLIRDNGAIFAWPLPTPPLFAASFVALSGPRPNWQEGLKARDALRHEESLRAIAHLNAWYACRGLLDDG
jgi:hypothetical protein